MDTDQVNLEELEAWFDDVWKILVDIHISLKNMERLKQEAYEFEDKIKRHGFFQHHWYQLKFISIVQLYKLTKNTEERSFEKICNKLINKKYSQDLKRHLKSLSDTAPEVCKDKTELALLCNQIKDSLTTKTAKIEKVYSLRNSVYAHKNSKSQSKNITLDELKELCDFLTDKYNELFIRTFLKEAYIFPQDWNIDYVLFHCSESFQSDEKERIKKKTRT